MHLTHRVRRFAAALAGLGAALVAFGITPAFAMVMPPAGGSDVVPQHLVPVHAVVAGGMPGWQIALIAAAAALLTATVAVLLDRARATRRNAVAAAA